MTVDNRRCLFLSFSGAVFGLQKGILRREDFHNGLYWLGCASEMITRPFFESLGQMGPWFFWTTNMTPEPEARALIPYFRFVRKRVRLAHVEGRVVWRARYSEDRLEPIDNFLGRFGYPPVRPVYENWLRQRGLPLAYADHDTDLDKACKVFGIAPERYDDLRVFGQFGVHLNGK